MLWAIEVCVEWKCHNTDSCRKVQNFNQKKKTTTQCSFCQCVFLLFFLRAAASKSCNEMLGQWVNYAIDADIKINKKIIFVKNPLNKVTHLIHTAPLLPTGSCFYIEMEIKWCLLNTHKRVPHHCSWLVGLWKKGTSLKYEKLFSLFGSTPLLQKQANDQIRHPQMTR